LPSPLVHFQLASPDPEAAKAFFEAVFDWRFGPGLGRVVATIDTGARQVDPNDIYPGGTLIQTAGGGESYAALFFRVPDLDATVAKAVSRGASVLVPRRRTEAGADIAIVTAPQGHVIGIVQQ
jgi:hypothetical protein